MNNNNLERIKELTKNKIAVSNFQKEENVSIKHEKLKFIKISSVACICIILTSGIVFAKDIEEFIKKKFNFGLGDGINTAAENGYIAEPEMEPKSSTVQVKEDFSNLGTIIDDINISAKINSFLMDDYNLSVEFDFEFDEKIQEIIDFDKLDQITLNDLIVLDEDNRIIYASTSMGKEKFDEFCIKHNLDYICGEFNENYMNCGLNWFPQNVIKTANKAGLIYNIYSDLFPKSKELNFYFNEIIITEANYELENEVTKNITLTGNWNIHVSVPEEMYNRTSENYKVISCENDRFEVYAAKVMDTGFEIGILISDVEKPIYPGIIREKERELLEKHEGETNRNDYSRDWSLLLAQSPYRELWNEYQFKKSPINVTGYNAFIIDEERANQLLNSPDEYQTGFKLPEKTEGSYVLNANGDKFVCTLSPSRNSHSKFIVGDRYDFYETFGMTKYDATDEITVIVEFYGEPFEIKLEKIK